MSYSIRFSGQIWSGYIVLGSLSSFEPWYYKNRSDLGINCINLEAEGAFVRGGFCPLKNCDISWRIWNWILFNFNSYLAISESWRIPSLLASKTCSYWQKDNFFVTDFITTWKKADSSPLFYYHCVRVLN